MRQKIKNIIEKRFPKSTDEEKEELAIDIIAFFENEGLSLIGNGWLDDESEEVIKKIENR